MKKIMYFIITCCLFAGSAAGCAGNASNQPDTRDLTPVQSDTASQEAADLQAQLDSAEAVIASQKDYISELTEQLAACQSLASGADADSGFDSDSDSDLDTGSSGNTDYTNKYPSLYAEKAYENKVTAPEKAVYLTFDDGPSGHTMQILDLLDQYHAKATFFVVYREEAKYQDYLSEIIARGHTLALHSYSHDYSQIYASVDDFLTDFQKVYDWVCEATGQRPTFYRFPGGSTKGERAVVDDIITEMERRGFIYYDWNVSSGDGSDLTPRESIIDNICDNVSYFENPVVLMHDANGKQATYEALPEILTYLQNNGYSFETLNEDMEPVQYLRK